MDDNKEQKRPRSRVKKGLSLKNYITIAIILLFVTSFYLYLRMHSSVSEPMTATSLQQALSDQTVPKPSPPATSLKPGQEIGETPPSLHSGTELTSPLQQSQLKTNATSSEPEDDTDTSISSSPLERVGLTEVSGNLNKEHLSPATVDGSERLTHELPPGAEKSVQNTTIIEIEQINSFYSHLDQQPYIKKLSLPEPSKAHFSKLLQKLVDNPPVVVRETDDLFTLLQNTAHFFRVLGKKNINTLKSILSNERDSFEQTIQAFYALTADPKLLEKEYGLTISPEVLTDYAGFFLNTMGGRLYLFRRDSASRMIVSYYAIITIHRASQSGAGGHGIDLRPAINNLVDDIEDGGKRLQLKEQYLDALYDLQEIYN